MMNIQKLPVICIMGPTATGKSDLAIRLTKWLPIDIISVDSAMVYRGLDIGSAKPDKQILEKIHHYLVDVCEPYEIYSVGQFCKDALDAIKKIHHAHRIPCLVGGTMLYFNALQKGLSDLPHQHPDIRKKIIQEAELQGWNILYEKLKKIDPLTASRLHPNDKQRISRALEVFELTGCSLTEYHQRHKISYLDNNTVINIGIMPKDNLADRKILKILITQRFNKMLENGLVQEVEKLYSKLKQRHLSMDELNRLPALRSVGYREVGEYLLGKIDFENMREKAIVASCQLAKRQMTWLRHWKNITFFDSASPHLATKLFHFLQTHIEDSQK